MGHRTLQMLQRYTHLDAQATKKFSNHISDKFSHYIRLFYEFKYHIVICYLRKNQAEAYEILNDFYLEIDDAFITYFISLTALKSWRPHLEKYEREYREK